MSEPHNLSLDEFLLLFFISTMLYLTNNFLLTGAYDAARAIIDEVIDNVNTPGEKLNAYTHRIMCLTSETSEYGKGLEIGLKILSKYGIDVPFSPTKAVMAKGLMKYKLALRNRSISCLASFPIKDDPLLALCKELNVCALCKSIILYSYCLCVPVILIPFYHYRFWKWVRLNAIELEDNTICSQEGQHKLEFGFCFGVMRNSACEYE